MEKYFVSYHHNELNNVHCGHTEVQLDHKITGIDSIREVAQLIENTFDYNRGTVIILNFKRFDSYE